MWSENDFVRICIFETEMIFDCFNKISCVIIGEADGTWDNQSIQFSFHVYLFEFL